MQTNSLSESSSSPARSGLADRLALFDKKDAKAIVPPNIPGSRASVSLLSSNSTNKDSKDSYDNKDSKSTSSVLRTGNRASMSFVTSSSTSTSSSNKEISSSTIGSAETLYPYTGVRRGNMGEEKKVFVPAKTPEVVAKKPVSIPSITAVASVSSSKSSSTSLASPSQQTSASISPVVGEKEKEKVELYPYTGIRVASFNEKYKSGSSDSAGSNENTNSPNRNKAISTDRQTSFDDIWHPISNISKNNTQSVSSTTTHVPGFNNSPNQTNQVKEIKNNNNNKVEAPKTIIEQIEQKTKVIEKEDAETVRPIPSVSSGLNHVVKVNSNENVVVVSNADNTRNVSNASNVSRVQSLRHQTSSASQISSFEPLVSPIETSQTQVISASASSSLDLAPTLIVPSTSSSSPVMSLESSPRTPIEKSNVVVENVNETAKGTNKFPENNKDLENVPSTLEIVDSFNLSSKSYEEPNLRLSEAIVPIMVPRTPVQTFAVPIQNPVSSHSHSSEISKQKEIDAMNVTPVEPRTLFNPHRNIVDGNDDLNKISSPFSDLLPSVTVPNFVTPPDSPAHNENQTSTHATTSSFKVPPIPLSITTSNRPALPSPLSSSRSVFNKPEVLENLATKEFDDDEEDEEVDEMEKDSNDEDDDEDSVIEYRQRQDSTTSSKREFVIAEIMATEKVYFDKLQALVDVYITPLENSKILSEQDLEMQFKGLKKIYLVHKNMYNKIFQHSGQREINIALLFSEFVSKLSEYKDYLVNFEPAIMRRGVLQTKNKQFSNFVENAALDPRCSDWGNLESLLITPVQRIPRYRLLFEDLLKHTPENHSEYNDIHVTLEYVKQVADENNEAIRHREKKEELMAIMMKIDESTRINLMDNPDRVVIRKGSLMRQCRREVKPFDFYLFTDLLIYCDDNPVMRSYKINRIIDLKTSHTTESPQVNVNPDCAFAVESPNKSFVVWADSPELKALWLIDINTAIAQLLNLQDVGEKGNGNRRNIAPIWKPDSSCKECLKCKQPFTLFKRKHHCRNCGLVVCNECSPYRHQLLHVEKNKSVRVCKDCNIKLSCI